MITPAYTNSKEAMHIVSAMLYSDIHNSLIPPPSARCSGEQTASFRLFQTFPRRRLAEGVVLFFINP